MKWLRTAWYDLIGQEDKIGPRTAQEKFRYRLGVAALFAFLAVAGIPLTGGLSLLLLLVTLRKVWLALEDGT